MNIIKHELLNMAHIFHFCQMKIAQAHELFHTLRNTLQTKHLSGHNLEEQTV